MPALKGNTTGVGRDIIDYLTMVANHFKLTIVITSGYRNADDQAKAMLKYWTKLKRGTVYSKKSLPEEDRKRLDAFYKTNMEDEKADIKTRAAAKASFLKLADDRMGNTSKHTKGRAVDITQASVSAEAYRAIVLRLKAVKEGSRRDIYHFESDALVPKVSDAEQKSWDDLSGAPVVQLPGKLIMLAGRDLPCLACS